MKHVELNTEIFAKYDMLPTENIYDMNHSYNTA